MKTIFYCILFIAFCFVFTSCSDHRYIYRSSKPNVAYFKEKGEAEASAVYGSSGLGAQGAYAFSNNFAVSADFTTSIKDVTKNNRLFNGDSASTHYDYHNFNIGVGYFKSLNKKETITLNIYAGGGLGKYKFKDKGEEENRFFDINHSSFYIQPYINFLFNEYIQLSILYKPTAVYYGSFSTDYTAEEQEFYGTAKLKNNNFIHHELGYQLQFRIPGIDWLYAQTYGSLNLGVSDRLLETKFHRHKANIGFGVSAKLDKL